jgi:hypothetical protein
METEVLNASTNFEPLLDFLSIEGTNSKEVGNVFDELLYDYARLNLVVQQMDSESREIIHEDAEFMLYWIKEIRDAVWRCDF